MTQAPKKQRRPPQLSLPTELAASHTTRSAILPPSKLTESLYLSSYEATKDREALQKAGVTHILNLAGELKCPPTHPNAFSYASIHLPDSPRVDILFFIYLALEFIEAAEAEGGTVLIHCVRGQSRAPAIACAYLMWKLTISFSEASERVRAVHPSSDPNLGFTVQLQRFRQLESQRVYHYNPRSGLFQAFASSDASSALIVSDDHCKLLLREDCAEEEAERGAKCIELLRKFEGVAMSPALEVH